MSKIIILAEPAEGHINPFMPIMVQLIAKGHELVCISLDRVWKKSGRFFKLDINDTLPILACCRPE